MRILVGNLPQAIFDFPQARRCAFPNDTPTTTLSANLQILTSPVRTTILCLDEH